ncbi:G-type lectin S-receptor-like serine/threonine-protein kinase [Tanacetum coccineum]
MVGEVGGVNEWLVTVVGVYVWWLLVMLGFGGCVVGFVVALEDSLLGQEVSDLAQDRPTMSLVVSMLDNDGVLPPPNQPAFFSEKSPVVMSSIPSTVAPVSVNNVTITVLDAR